MNKKQLIVTSVLVLSMLVLAISQGFFNENFQRISISDKTVDKFIEYNLNTDDYYISLPEAWHIEEQTPEGYVDYLLKFSETNNNVNGVIQVINTNEDVEVFADRDVKNQSLAYSDLKNTAFEENKRYGVLSEYNTSIKNGNKYKNKCYYLVLNDSHIVKLLFNIKNSNSDYNADAIIHEIISSIKDAK